MRVQESSANFVAAKSHCGHGQAASTRYCAAGCLAVALTIDFVAGGFLGAGSGSGEKAKEHPMISAMRFIRVPKGVFWMGGDSKGLATKRVEIKEDFELAAFLVTQEQWQAVMGKNPSWFSRHGGGKDKVKDIPDDALRRFPVEEVWWDDVQEFLRRLNRAHGNKGRIYRLPTEVEWEYACRGAAHDPDECSFDFYLTKPTNNLSSLEANFDGRTPGGTAAKGPALGRPSQVGSYPPNPLELFDMHGNVYQWSSDTWESDGAKRVVRGGSWNLGAFECRAAERRWAPLALKTNPPLRGCLGLRLARGPASGKH